MDQRDIPKFLKNIEPFGTLSFEALESLSRRVEIRDFKSGTHVFRQGDPSLDCLLVVVSGLVEIAVTDGRGVETHMGYREPGDFFSETVVLSGQKYPASARVIDDVVCIAVFRKDLEEMIYAYPEFSSYFNSLLAERMRLLYERILTDQNRAAYGRLEMPLFRKRVREIMTRDVVTCREEDPVVRASEAMAKRRTSSAVVVDSEGTPLGMITEKLLVRHLVIRRNVAVGECTVGRIMNRRFAAIDPDAVVGQALVEFARRKTKYLLAMEKGKLVGILTAMDLIRSRNVGNLVLMQDIESVTAMEDLARIGEEIDAVLNALLTEGARAPEILDVISELHERLARAVIGLAEAEMEARGLGPPPVDYCWINMGSDARHEQPLRTDQDNAMIYADPDPEDREATDAYFGTLAEIVVSGLDRCGFALCKGNVMATNPLWRRSLGQWLSYVKSWSTSMDPDDFLAMTILLDFRPIWGNQALAKTLWDRIFAVFEEPEKINHMLIKEDERFPLPLTFMGNIRTEKSGPRKNQVNLKTGGVVHIVNGARLFAVNHQIAEPSTLGRLEQLAEKGVFSRRKAGLFQACFETLTMLKVRGNLRKIQRNETPDNFIDPEDLSSSELVLLKDALATAGHMQKLMQMKFSQPALDFFS